MKLNIKKGSKNYNKVVVNLLKEDKEVKIFHRNDFSREKLNFLLHTSNNLSDQERVLKIIDYFLTNSNIYQINRQETLPSYKGCFSTVSGSNNLMLALKLDDSDLAKSITKLVMNKYYQDRNNYYINHDLNNIYVSSNSSYYGENMCLLIDKTTYMRLLKSEKKFLKELIKSKLDYKSEAHIQELEYLKLDGPISDGMYFICGDLKISIDSFIIHNVLSEVIYEYTIELRKEKEDSFQLKLKI